MIFFIIIYFKKIYYGELRFFDNYIIKVYIYLYKLMQVFWEWMLRELGMC